ncbi:hypothetical protein H696_06033 [Fonticula alba]|uniref:Tyrosine--tRNA ligase n=1 Tax=Fonticula alba TaxID=691883 RepID=A0A058YZV1_FONAL|nr:hypothetical protein H696_06033 [Fonticula alba]KCV67514.1 hypothetical protein H696_06033 [Fonticula alba]|eukprot:XP_009498075.1 hypothetical protein H696_06033 [Fonticula alba]
MDSIELITKNLQEHLSINILADALNRQDDAARIYWGTAPTGKPHIGYFVPLVKIAEFLKAGCQMTILFADLHAFLDHNKSTLDVLEHRSYYYERVITQALVSIGVPIDQLTFSRGMSYQLKSDYSKDVLQLCKLVSLVDAKRAGAEVVKQVDSPLLSGMVYPLLQALDEQYLLVDAQFGGVDQRKIFTFAYMFLPRLGYRRRAHLLNPMVPGLQGAKMSASQADSKIDLLDSRETIFSKIATAQCSPGEIEGNPLLCFAQYVLFPARALNPAGGPVTLAPAAGGAPRAFDTFDQLRDAFQAGEVTPDDLRALVSTGISDLIDPIREQFTGDARWAESEAKGYPTAEATGAAPCDDLLDELAAMDSGKMTAELVAAVAEWKAGRTASSDLGPLRRAVAPALAHEYAHRLATASGDRLAAFRARLADQAQLRALVQSVASYVAEQPAAAGAAEVDATAAGPLGLGSVAALLTQLLSRLQPVDTAAAAAGGEDGAAGLSAVAAVQGPLAQSVADIGAKAPNCDFVDIGRTLLADMASLAGLVERISANLTDADQVAPLLLTLCVQLKTLSTNLNSMRPACDQSLSKSRARDFKAKLDQLAALAQELLPGCTLLAGLLQCVAAWLGAARRLGTEGTLAEVAGQQPVPAFLAAVNADLLAFLDGSSQLILTFPAELLAQIFDVASDLNTDVSAFIDTLDAPFVGFLSAAMAALEAAA